MSEWKNSPVISPMTLGTVQLGMNYGIANELGKPSEEKSFAMLRTALENGVSSLDTARAYGDAEEVLGRFFKTWHGEMPYLTTKIPKFKGEGSFSESYAVSCVEESLERLGVKKLQSVMLHSVQDMYESGTAAARAMEKLVRMGYADTVGVSVYDEKDVREMLSYPQYRVTQIPMSIFDQRLIFSGAVDSLRRAGYTTFVRSVFLQGVFFLDPEKITDPILKEYALPKICRLRQIAAAEGMSVSQIAITFMRDTLGVTSLVLGADTPEQVMENVNYFDLPSLSPSLMETLRNDFSDVNVPQIMKVLSRPKPQNP